MVRLVQFGVRRCENRLKENIAAYTKNTNGAEQRRTVRGIGPSMRPVRASQEAYNRQDPRSTHDPNSPNNKDYKVRGKVTHTPTSLHTRHPRVSQLPPGHCTRSIMIRVDDTAPGVAQEQQTCRVRSFSPGGSPTDAVSRTREVIRHSYHHRGRTQEAR